MTNIIVNPKFRELLDLPSETERKELESQLIRDGGPRDPITIWKGDGAIVDGHNRYQICIAHNLKFQTREMEFKDEDAVIEFIIENQIGRRNLSPQRAAYFMGLLYNKSKQDPAKVRTATEDGKTTAEVIADKFGVSEKSVRRAGEEVKGIEAVAAAKGIANAAITAKLNAIKDKTAPITKGELQEIGKAPSPEIAKAAAKELLKQKTEEVKAKVKLPTAKPAATKEKPTTYPVIFTKPAFDRLGFNVTTEERPPIGENCMLYMYADDENLSTALDLFKRWGLHYEATFVFETDGHEGMWSDINHTFLLAGSKGTMTGPKKVSRSMLDGKQGLEAGMIKLIDTYHKDAKRFDARKGVTAEGWEKKAA